MGRLIEVVEAPNRAELPVAIVGGGFSGTLLAVNLIRRGVRVILVERHPDQLAKGIAFGTQEPEHLLNVHAANMSAFPDDLRHFLRWQRFETSEDANRFVPRMTYGTYLRDLLTETVAAAPDCAEIRYGEAVAARFADDAITVSMACGATVACRALVLALGNFAPQPHPLLAALPPSIYFADPWQAAAARQLHGIDHVVLLGTGLTAVDLALSLDSAGFRGRITALSRRGLRPHGHAERRPVVGPRPEPETSGSWLVRAVRMRAREVGWRVAVDELRPHTQHIWRRHDGDAKRRFLRHLRPYWDVHRHRLASPVAARIAALEQEGRLTFAAGKLTAARVEDGRAQLHVRPRGRQAEIVLCADRIVNCTGPESDLARAGSPLVDDLLAQGLVRSDAHRLGFDVEPSGRVRGADGTVRSGLFAIGAITKGEAWEIVAVPDIRRQVWDLARLLANAHWVEGEGL